jgi:hypothetical protein
MDLFNPPDYQDPIRDAMQKQWQDDVAAINKRRIIPDWKGEPKPLSKDKAALLDYLYEHGFIAWPGNPGPERIKVAKMLGYAEKKSSRTSAMLDLGIDENTIAVANAKAVIDACLDDGLIETRYYRGQNVLQMTRGGEYALEEWQIEREMEFCDECQDVF